MLEILRFQWNYGYGIVANVAEVFGESTLSRMQVFEWNEAFSEGREVAENLPHASRLSTSVNDNSIEKVNRIVLENRRHCQNRNERPEFFARSRLIVS